MIFTTSVPVRYIRICWCFIRCTTCDQVCGHSQLASGLLHASNSVFSPPGVVNLTRLPSPLSQVPANQLSNVSSASVSTGLSPAPQLACISCTVLLSPDFWANTGQLLLRQAHTRVQDCALLVFFGAVAVEVQNFAQNSFLASTPPPVSLRRDFDCEAEGNDGLDASQTLRRKTRPPRRTTYPSCNRARGPPPHSSSGSRKCRWVRRRVFDAEAPTMASAAMRALFISRPSMKFPPLFSYLVDRYTFNTRALRSYDLTLTSLESGEIRRHRFFTGIPMES